jgi:signal transduction histidine kinase
MLRSGTLDEATARRALEVVDRNVDHQAKLITDLLDISRIISGKLTLEMAVVDLAAVVASVVETMRPSAEAKSITATSRLTTGAVPVDGDGERLRQVVANLLSNAVKFTPSGGRVTVELTNAGDRARLAVTDTGKGISGQFLPHVFERFRQADASSTRAEAGLGLGLAIVRHIVELHRGGVRADSAGDGTGATFTVDLPIAAPAADRPGDAVGCSPASATRRGISVNGISAAGRDACRPIRGSTSGTAFRARRTRPSGLRSQRPGRRACRSRTSWKAARVRRAAISPCTTWTSVA